MMGEQPDDERSERAETLAPPSAGEATPATGATAGSAAPEGTAKSTAAIQTPTAPVTPSTSIPAADAPRIGGPFGATVPGPAVPGPDYSTAGVPSLDYVRDKIEGRYAHSLGATELAEGIPEVRSFEEQAAKREEAARDKLEEIRRSLRGGSTS